MLKFERKEKGDVPFLSLCASDCAVFRSQMKGNCAARTCREFAPQFFIRNCAYKPHWGRSVRHCLPLASQHLSPTPIVAVSAVVVVVIAAVRVLPRTAGDCSFPVAGGTVCHTTSLQLRRLPSCAKVPKLTRSFVSWVELIARVYRRQMALWQRALTILASAKFLSLYLVYFCFIVCMVASVDGLKPFLATSLFGK